MHRPREEEAQAFGCILENKCISGQFLTLHDERLKRSIKQALSTSVLECHGGAYLCAFHIPYPLALPTSHCACVCVCAGPCCVECSFEWKWRLFLAVSLERTWLCPGPPAVSERCHLPYRRAMQTVVLSGISFPTEERIWVIFLWPTIFHVNYIFRRCK